MGLIATAPKYDSAHWYTPAGEPLYEVPRADGKGMRPTTLRDASAMGLYPSVTTVEQILDKPPLNKWKVEQGILAALTTERKDNESLDDFAARVAEEAESVSGKARDLGSAIHAAIEADLTGAPSPAWPAGAEEMRAKWRSWARGELDLTDAEYERIVCHPLGYGGKVDFYGSDAGGHPLVLDWKTQGTKPGRKANAYDSWGRQLAAYAEALGAPPECRLLNVVLSTTEPGRLEVVEWTDRRPELFRQFKAIFWLWCLLKGYWPGGEFDIAPVSRILASDEHAGNGNGNGNGLIAVGQIAGLRQLASGEGRVVVDIGREQWPLLAVRGSVGTMVNLTEEENHGSA